MVLVPHYGNKTQCEQFFLEQVARFSQESVAFDDPQLIAAAVEAHMVQHPDDREFYYEQQILPQIRIRAVRGSSSQPGMLQTRLHQFEAAFQKELQARVSEEQLTDFFDHTTPTHQQALNATITRPLHSCEVHERKREAQKEKDARGVVDSIRSLLSGDRKDKRDTVTQFDDKGYRDFLKAQLDTYVAANEGHISDRVFERLEKLTEDRRAFEHMRVVFNHPAFIQDPRVVAVLESAFVNDMMFTNFRLVNYDRFPFRSSHEWLTPGNSHPSLMPGIDERILPIVDKVFSSPVFFSPIKDDPRNKKWAEEKRGPFINDPETVLLQMLNVLSFLPHDPKTKLKFVQNIAHANGIKKKISLMWFLARSFKNAEEREALREFGETADEKTKDYIDKILSGHFEHPLVG